MIENSRTFRFCSWFPGIFKSLIWSMFYFFFRTASTKWTNTNCYISHSFRATMVKNSNGEKVSQWKFMFLNYPFNMHFVTRLSFYTLAFHPTLCIIAIVDWLSFGFIKIAFCCWFSIHSITLSTSFYFTLDWVFVIFWVLLAKIAIYVYRELLMEVFVQF